MPNDYISRDYAVENMENYPWDTEHDRNSAIHLVRELVPPADVRPVNNRYIDGNELFRRIAGHSYYKGDDILTRISLMQEGKSPKKKDIKPADVRPVVMGKWNVVKKPLEKATICECSECNHRIWMYDGDDGWNYCPHCGADMRPERGTKE